LIYWSKSITLVLPLDIKYAATKSDFFELIHEHKHGGARAGIMHTEHGDIARVFYAGRHAGGRENLGPNRPKNYRRADNFGQHLSSAFAPGENLIDELGDCINL